MKWTSNEIAILGMATTVTVAILSALTAYLAAKRERRRTLYSEATQSVVGWKEMLYRVRRRDKDQDKELVSQFHDLQDKLTYYQAWVGSESVYMSRSYSRLVKSVKGATDDLIRDAWDKTPSGHASNAGPDDVHPDIEQFVSDFLKDVRSHLSPLPWRKLAVAYRNHEGQ